MKGKSDGGKECVRCVWDEGLGNIDVVLDIGGVCKGRGRNFKLRSSNIGKLNFWLKDRLVNLGEHHYGFWSLWEWMAIAEKEVVILIQIVVYMNQVVVSNNIFYHMYRIVVYSYLIHVTGLTCIILICNETVICVDHTINFLFWKTVFVSHGNFYL